MLETEARRCSFVLVGNIPSALRSSDLRAFFSHLVEKGGFSCFHFRHRPEHLTPSQVQELQTEGASTAASSEELSPKGGHGGGESEASNFRGAADEVAAEGDGVRPAASRCCVVAVERRWVKELLRRYRNRLWAKASGESVGGKVRITKLSVSFEGATTAPRSTGGETEGTTRDNLTSAPSEIPWGELCSLPELNPPSVMPRGNVGTPTSLFMQLIHQCRLPARLIKKLELEFPRSRSKRRYGAVGLDYGTEMVEGGEEEEREENRGGGKEGDEKVERDTDGNERVETDEERISSDDDHDAEEWERYEALHEDVDKQERTKERLYEEEMEVVWEKGGSGLVFYTDASHWHEMEGDFDEQCSKEDDWDVDTSLYYDRDGGDKSSRDLRAMDQEERIRAGKDQGTVFGGFEKYTKGIGSKVLKRSGWREGSGVGRSSEGIAEPLETEGQHPQSKRGLGYYGEKLIRHAPDAKKRRKATRDVIIATVYDKPEEEESSVLRTAPPRTIKYRQEVKFVAGASLRPDSRSQTEDQTKLHTPHPQ